MNIKKLKEQLSLLFEYGCDYQYYFLSNHEVTADVIHDNAEKIKELIISEFTKNKKRNQNGKQKNT